MPNRENARALARQYSQENNPLGWFEPFYAAANGNAGEISWADLAPNPNLVTWLDHQSNTLSGRALVIGTGLGDDAEELSRRGFNVTAFDISPTAINWCRRRFPHSKCNYVHANLLDPPGDWAHSFDLVVEAYTLQCIPAGLRPRAIQTLATFLAPGATLLIICRGRNETDPEGSMPWPLTRPELDILKAKAALIERKFEAFFDGETPPVYRFGGEYFRSSERL